MQQGRLCCDGFKAKQPKACFSKRQNAPPKSYSEEPPNVLSVISRNDVSQENQSLRYDFAIHVLDCNPVCPFGGTLYMDDYPRPSKRTIRLELGTISILRIRINLATWISR